jgi:hypothetical protein
VQYTHFSSFFVALTRIQVHRKEKHLESPMLFHVLAENQRYIEYEEGEEDGIEDCLSVLNEKLPVNENVFSVPISSLSRIWAYFPSKILPFFQHKLHVFFPIIKLKTLFSFLSFTAAQKIGFSMTTFFETKLLNITSREKPTLANGPTLFQLYSTLFPTILNTFQQFCHCGTQQRIRFSCN